MTGTFETPALVTQFKWVPPEERLPPQIDRDELLLSAWLTRKIAPRDYLLGNVFCTTSRWLVYGETGVGKSLFTYAMGGAIASGSAFLNWEARRPAKVMLFDGEMPAETFKERMQTLADQFGDDLPIYAYSREVLSDGDMPPFNTETGEAWLWREIEAVQPDVIIFDSIMCLLAGSMVDEDAWEPVKLLIRKISARRIGQIWIHHTGHDKSKSYGTKTREWELDTVLSLTKAEDDAGGVLAEFTKARLRTPKTLSEFETRVIRCGEDGWASDDAAIVTLKGGKRSGEVRQMRSWFLTTYERLIDNVATSPGHNGSPVKKVHIDQIRDEMVSRGYLDRDDKGRVSNTSRTHLRRAKLDLITEHVITELDGMVWKIKD
jgi:hypothetical protein